MDIKEALKSIGFDVDQIRRALNDELRPDYDRRAKLFAELTDSVAGGMDSEEDDRVPHAVTIVKALSKSELERHDLTVLLGVAITEHAILKLRTGNVSEPSESEEAKPAEARGHDCGCELHAEGTECGNCGPVDECKPGELPEFVKDVLTKIGIDPGKATRIN